jgi:hypothetical protein
VAGTRLRARLQRGLPAAGAGAGAGDGDGDCAVSVSSLRLSLRQRLRIGQPPGSQLAGEAAHRTDQVTFSTQQ